MRPQVAYEYMNNIASRAPGIPSLETPNAAIPTSYSKLASADQWTVNWREGNTRYGSKHFQAIFIQRWNQRRSWKGIATKIPSSAFESESMDDQVDDKFSNSVPVFC